MSFAIHAERLAETFVSLCEIDSPSRQEGTLSARLQQLFQEEFSSLELLAEDDSAQRTGSDCGNLLVRFAGDPARLPLFFNCHLDTVRPACGVKVQRRGNIFRSQGETILGGDDKAGIAILLEAMRTVRDQGLPAAPTEFLLTTCEEIGLLGAKAFEPQRLRARHGYALDSTGVDLVIIGAPAANRLRIEVSGVAAHAGLAPEQGINAIQLAAQAIAGLPLGRLDQDSTANIGVIAGGTATNIVPDQVLVEGEIRSHDPDKLRQHTQVAESLFRNAVSAWQPPTPDFSGRPGLSFQVSEEYPALRLGDDSLVVQRLRQAASRLGRRLAFEVAGGGSDANILHHLGLETAILGIGMQDVHSCEEWIDLRDMVRTCELVVSLITS